MGLVVVTVRAFAPVFRAGFIASHHAFGGLTCQLSRPQHSYCAASCRRSNSRRARCGARCTARARSTASRLPRGRASAVRDTRPHRMTRPPAACDIGRSANRRLSFAFLVQCRKRSVVDAVDGGIERVIDAGLVCENALDLSHPGDVAATDESRCNLQAAV